MYISKELFVIILLSILYAIHIIIHIVELVKIHNLKSNKPITLNTVKEKGKELFLTLLKPENSIISGLKEFIFNSVHSMNKEDEKEEKSEKEDGSGDG